MAPVPKPWADTPFSLIATPGLGQDLKKLDDHVWMAREMAFAHNGMLRCLNSIYQQCIHVSEPADIKDMLKYVEFWCGWIHEHHEGEETILFPKIEEVTRQKGLMERNVEQHHAFMGGLEELQRYSQQTKVEEYDGMKMRGIIDGFGQKLTEHLTAEIETFLELEKYPDPAVKKAFVAFDAEMRKGDVHILFPIVLGTADREQEGVDWPEVPGAIRYLVHYWFERRYQGVWRLTPSTTWGQPRPLIFTGEEC